MMRRQGTSLFDMVSEQLGGISKFSLNLVYYHYREYKYPFSVPFWFIYENLTSIFLDSNEISALKKFSDELPQARLSYLAILNLALLIKAGLNSPEPATRKAFAELQVRFGEYWQYFEVLEDNPHSIAAVSARLNSGEAEVALNPNDDEEALDHAQVPMFSPPGGSP